MSLQTRIEALATRSANEVRNLRNSLGNSSTRNVGTTAGTVAAGDDSRFGAGGAPSGPAGGDLAGTYPNPTLANANLNAIEGLVGAADQNPYFTGVGTMALHTVTSFARTLLSRASAAAMRNDLDVYSKAESSALLAGSEMGYAERTTSFTTTNTTAGNVTSTAVPTGLSVTVVGEGKAVDIQFHAVCQHSVANGMVAGYFLVNGSYTTPTAQGAGFLGAVQMGATGAGRTLHIERRVVLTNGVTYTFTIGFYSTVAGTSTVVATAGIPSVMKVTRR